MKTQNKSKSTSLQKPMRRFQKPKKVELCSKIKLKRIKRIGKRFLCFFQHNRPQPSIAQMTHAEHSSWVIQPQWPPACVSYFYPQMQNPSLQWIAFSPTFDKIRANWRRFIRSFSVYFFSWPWTPQKAASDVLALRFLFVDSWLQPLLWVQALFSRELSRKFPGLFLLPWPKKERSSSFFLVCQMPPFSHFLIFHLFKVKRHISRFHLHTAFCGGPSVSTTSWLAIHQRTGGISHPKKASQTSIVIKRSSVEIVIGLRA